jgi:hypothetical protein
MLVMPLTTGKFERPAEALSNSNDYKQQPRTGVSLHRRILTSRGRFRERAEPALLSK